MLTLPARNVCSTVNIDIDLHVLIHTELVYLEYDIKEESMEY
jgi:hypothetical protein